MKRAPLPNPRLLCNWAAAMLFWFFLLAEQCILSESARGGLLNKETVSLRCKSSEPDTSFLLPVQLLGRELVSCGCIESFARAPLSRPQLEPYLRILSIVGKV